MIKQKILTGNGSRTAFELLDRALRSKSYKDARYFILVDENTSEHCLPALVAEVEALQQAEFFEMESGEGCKDIAVANNLWLSLLESGADRNAVMVNLGGGTISDLGGFVASAYKRGIRYINVPTSLLGMTDASIGGKTAINSGGLKNQVGFFHLPQFVCIEPQLLATLPAREMLSGMFEMVKTFAVAEREAYLRFMERFVGAYIPEESLIYRCADIKADIVKRDFREDGERKVLNFGHTFGHAIESLSLLHDDKPISHGEAVGLGMVCAMWLSVEKYGLDRFFYEDFAEKAFATVGRRNYTTQQTDELVSIISNDKKNVGGEVRGVLLEDIGKPVYDVPLTKSEIKEAFLHV